MEQLIMFLIFELPLLLEFVQAPILSLLQSLMLVLVPPHLPGLFQLLMLGGLLEPLVLKLLEALSPQSSQAAQDIKVGLQVLAYPLVQVQLKLVMTLLLLQLEILLVLLLLELTCQGLEHPD